jgi:PAS domain-containing protein
MSKPSVPLRIDEALQLAAETAGVGTWNLFVIENELHSSPQCKELFGLSADASFEYEDFLSLVHPDDKPMVEEAVAQALDPNGTGLYEVDYRIVRPDGVVRWIGVKGKAFF